MDHFMKRLFYVIVIMLCFTQVRAQDSSAFDKLISIPNKVFSALDKRSSSAEKKLAKQTNRYLAKLQKQEQKVKRKILKKDPLLAEQTFGDIDKVYKDFRNLTGSPDASSSVYSAHLDSLSTVLGFLNDSAQNKI